MTREEAIRIIERVDICANAAETARDMAISALREQAKWIPVSEQEEPTENGTYLCHGYWFGSRRKQTETAEFFGEWNIANNFILTHWMPLPEPPEEEAK